MKFLVILICVGAAYLWKQELDRINDNWFFVLRGRIEQLFSPLQERYSHTWLLIYLATFAVPLISLTLILWLCAGWLAGLITMIVHVFVLLMAFDRTQPGLLASQYRELREAGDDEGCREFLRQELGYAQDAEDRDLGLHEIFSRLFVYRCFEKMFVMFFWYLVAGPLAVLVAYICYQLRDGVLNLADPEAEPTSRREVQSITAFIGFLEWFPVRLLGLTLSLVGNFESCFERLLKTGWSSETGTDTTVHEYARCALSARDKPDGEEEVTGQAGNSSALSGQTYSAQQHSEVDELEALMTRSQVIWLTVIALITIFMEVS